MKGFSLGLALKQAKDNSEMVYSYHVLEHVTINMDIKPLICIYPCYSKHDKIPSSVLSWSSHALFPSSRLCFTSTRSWSVSTLSSLMSCPVLYLLRCGDEKHVYSATPVTSEHTSVRSEKQVKWQVLSNRSRNVLTRYTLFLLKQKIRAKSKLKQSPMPCLHETHLPEVN